MYSRMFRIEIAYPVLEFLLRGGAQFDRRCAVLAIMCVDGERWLVGRVSDSVHTANLP